MPDQAKDVNWAEIVHRGIETQELDYKTAVNWNELTRAQKAKFARHAMAMANSRGGFIVVGVGEDPGGNPVLRTGLNQDQLKSFDPSTVGQTVNRYADPSIDFDIVRPEVDGKRYAIFVIRPFHRLPHVCSDSCGLELQQGVFYIRTQDARSRAACRASELHGLVQRALRNQRQVLGRMLRGILYEGRQFAEPDAEVEFQKQLVDSQILCRQIIGPLTFKNRPFLEVSAYPSKFRHDDQVLSEVRHAVEIAVVPPLTDFTLLDSPDQHSYFTNQSFLSRPKSPSDNPRFCFWQAFQSGLFHHISSLTSATDPRAISYPRLMSRIVTATAFLGQLYTEMGLEDDLITFTFTVMNSENYFLTDVPSDESASYLCYIPEVVVRKRRTVGDLASSPEDHAQKVIKEICERFNVDASKHFGLHQRLTGILHGQQPERSQPAS